MSKNHVYRTLIVPASFGVRDMFSMLSEVDNYSNDFTEMLYDSLKSWVKHPAERYELSEEEIDEISLFELDERGQLAYKKSLVAKKYIKENIVSILSPIAYKTFYYNQYIPIGISKERDFYILCSGGETYGEDSSSEAAGLRIIKSMNFKELRLK